MQRAGADAQQCPAGSYCVQNRRTLEYSCQSGQLSEPEPTGFTATRRTTFTLLDTSTRRTTFTLADTSTRTLDLPPAPRPTPTCARAGDRLCADGLYCCPAGEYCFYDTAGAPRCWDGVYYTYRWYYTWSYSFGVRWFRSTTSTYIASHESSRVLRLTTPTPPLAPDTADAVPAPSTIRSSVDEPLPSAAGTATALPAGSPPDSDELPAETGRSGSGNGGGGASNSTELPFPTGPSAGGGGSGSGGGKAFGEGGIAWMVGAAAAVVGVMAVL